jgi:hypothetical protein
MKKKNRKLLKRVHIQAVISVQEKWIGNAGLPNPASRKERDRLFSKSRESAHGLA